MARLKRGLRKEFEETAIEIRNDLGLSETAAICPRAIADFFNIPIMKMSDLGLAKNISDLLVSRGKGQFFACVISLGISRKGILHNDSVSLFRQNSDLAHELAHIIQGHPLRPAAIGNDERTYDPIHEHEARELGMTLLVPKNAALEIAMAGSDFSEASAIYSVSRSLIQHRLRITNAVRWAYNRKKQQRTW